MDQPVDPLQPCQRWREKRESYRPAGEPFDSSIHGVELIEHEDARGFIERHHYSHGYPAAQCRVGMFRSRGPFAKAELVGVCVFGVPQNEATIPKWTAGLGPRQGTCLSRLVLLNEVEGNGESFFVSRAFRLLHQAKPLIKAIVSYADPVRRRDAEGNVYKPGHIGFIYQRLGGVYSGRSSSEKYLVAPSGAVFSPRTLSKLRNGEQGAAGAEAQLLKLGAPRRIPGESDRAYVARILPMFSAFRHPGNHVYLWPLAGKVEAKFIRRRFASLPYPGAPDDLESAPAQMAEAA